MTAPAGGDTARSAAAARLLTAYVVLVAIHSYAVGAFLLFATEWGARFGGFGSVSPLFFARQAGVFHFVIATTYLVERLRYGGIVVLVTAKVTAVLFLAATWILGTHAWSVPLSAAADAVMGLLAVVLARRASALPG